MSGEFIVSGYENRAVAESYAVFVCKLCTSRMMLHQQAHMKCSRFFLDVDFYRTTSRDAPKAYWQHR